MKRPREVGEVLDRAAIGARFMASCLPLVLLLAGFAAAQEPDDAAAELAPQVRALVRQLNDTQLSQREAAERKLVDLGPAALPFLPPVTSRTPAEVQQRLTRIRQILQRAAAEAAVQPTLVSLAGPLKLSAALEALAAQSFNGIVDYRANLNQQPTDSALDLEFKDRPFWEALDTVLDAAGLTIYPYASSEGKIAVVAGDEGALPRSERASYSGPFRVEATEIEASLDLRNPERRSSRITLETAWEPRLQPILLRQSLEGLTITDDAGRSIAVDGARGELETPLNSRFCSTTLSIPLVIVDREAKKIAEMKGKLTAVVPGRVERFEFTNLGKERDVQQPRGGVVVTLELARKNGDAHEIRIRVRFDQAGDALQSHLRWIFDNKAVLIDPEGKEIADPTRTPTAEAENEIGMSYVFAVPTLEGYTFVYETPGALVELPIPYTLRDIPLP